MPAGGETDGASSGPGATATTGPSGSSEDTEATSGSTAPGSGGGSTTADPPSATGGPAGDGGPASCTAVGLGSLVPVGFSGSLSQEDANDFEPETGCATSGGGFDVTIEWTAPRSGTYAVDTLGSHIDTVLYVLQGCGGPQLACNDDIDFDNHVQASAVELVLEAGQTIVIVVDGFDDSELGGFELSVREMPSA